MIASILMFTAWSSHEDVTHLPSFNLANYDLVKYFPVFSSAD